MRRPLIRLAARAALAMREEAARAYPDEACGALLGPFPGQIADAVPLANRELERPRARFSIDPLDYLAVEDLAASRGELVLGFWHSHPDHPAVPSETDAELAWQGLLTLIVPVARGHPGAPSAWTWSEALRIFEPVPLTLEPAEEPGSHPDR